MLITLSGFPDSCSSFISHLDIRAHVIRLCLFMHIIAHCFQVHWTASASNFNCLKTGCWCDIYILCTFHGNLSREWWDAWVQCWTAPSAEV